MYCICSVYAVYVYVFVSVGMFFGGYFRGLQKNSFGSTKKARTLATPYAKGGSIPAGKIVIV